MEKKLRLMDSSGDSAIVFDETEAKEAARVEAKALFERITGKGGSVFSINRAGGEPDKRIKDFNELEQDNIAVPRIVGG